MLILGIESSCDETAAAVLEDGSHLLSNIVNSQIDIHGKYGGVVPELASRKHMENIYPVIHEALAQSEISLDQLDGIGAFRHPRSHEGPGQGAGRRNLGRVEAVLPGIRVDRAASVGDDPRR